MTTTTTAINEWMLRSEKARKPPTIYDAAELVGKIFSLVFTHSNII